VRSLTYAFSAFLRRQGRGRGEASGCAAPAGWKISLPSPRYLLRPSKIKRGGGRGVFSVLVPGFRRREGRRFPNIALTRKE